MDIRTGEEIAQDRAARVEAAAQIALAEVARELDRAQLRFGPFASPHEGYAVVLEELDELWVEIKDNKRVPNEYRAALRSEAVQVAAMALRLVIDCTTGGPAPVRGEGEPVWAGMSISQMIARITEAEDQRDGARLEVHGHHRAYLSMEAERDDLQQQLAKLQECADRRLAQRDKAITDYVESRAALAKYGAHMPECSGWLSNVHRGDLPCTCGLADALAATTPTAGGS